MAPLLTHGHWSAGVRLPSGSRSAGAHHRDKTVSAAENERPSPRSFKPPTNGAGDLREFEDLYRGWWEVVRKSAERVLGSADEAEDIAQRVFLRLLDGGDPPQIHHPSAFFGEAGRNEAISRKRSLKRRADLLATARGRQALDALYNRGILPDATVRERELRRTVSRLLGELSPRCRMVCDLVYVQGFRRGEAAERLGIGIKAVDKQLARGRARLRQSVALSTTRGKGGRRALVASLS